MKYEALVKYDRDLARQAFLAGAGKYVPPGAAASWRAGVERDFDDWWLSLFAFGAATSPTAAPAAYKQRWKCYDRSCPSREPVTIEQRPTCYTCGQPMSLYSEIAADINAAIDRMRREIPPSAEPDAPVAHCAT